MELKQKLSSEEGYTLIETVVAMSIFTLVLSIFLTFFIKVLFSNDTIELKRAMIVCQSHLSIPDERSEMVDSQEQIGSLSVSKKYILEERLITIVVGVSSNKDGRELVTMSRSFSLR